MKSWSDVGEYLTENVDEEEIIGGFDSRIVNIVRGNDENLVFLLNALMKFYFVATISVVLRGELCIESYFHFFCCVCGFVAGFRELLWDDEVADQSFFCSKGFFFVQVICFATDLVFHIIM
jgi:hypothetical protein